MISCASWCSTATCFRDGSNVYNANLAAALRRAGHEVHLFSQDRHPERLDFVDAVGEWHDGRLTVRTLREPVRCTAYRPDIGPVLPVYVADRYEGVDARPFPELSQPELDRYLDANVEAVRDVAGRVAPDVALANHLVMGPADPRPRPRRSVPFAVVVHGSALEYTVKPHPRFLPYAHEGIDSARACSSARATPPRACGRRSTTPRCPRGRASAPRGGHRGLPGPRTAKPRPRVCSGWSSASPRSRRPGSDGSSFRRDTAAAARALGQLRPGEDRIVLFLGKEILAKGLDLLLAAWPLVLQRLPDARLVVVGFGAWHPTAVRMTAALADERPRRGARDRRRGPRRRGRPARPAASPARVPRLAGGRDPTAFPREARAGMDKRVVFTGRLEHEEMADLLPACEALVVPSTFPEAYGMVAAEAASCGTLPISADHSGLAEVSRVLEAAVPREVAPWLRFRLDDEAVPRPRGVPDRLARSARAAARTHPARAHPVAREHFSWDGSPHA